VAGTLEPCEINDSEAESRHSATGGWSPAHGGGYQPIVPLPLIPRRGYGISTEFSRMLFLQGALKYTVSRYVMASLAAGSQ